MDCSEKVEQILAMLAERDVAGGAYPLDAIEPEDRRRWNQSRLIAVALHQSQVPSMLPGEYTQSIFMMAQAIYSQSRSQFPTGTDAELVDEIATAVAQGWI